MFEDRYNVTIDNEIIAQNMELPYAFIFTKALFNEYYNDDSLQICIERTARAER